MTNTAALRLDHLVIAVHDLDAAIASYRGLGFTVQPGGQHPGRTSHNALVVFEDGAYFELIAWQAPAPQERWWRVLTGHGEGLVDFALLPHDTTAVVQAAQARGLTGLVGPLDGGRLRPDGERLVWQTARHATPDLPFLCGDVTPRALRVPEGAVRQHANGVSGVAGVQLVVADLAASVARYRALLGSGMAPPETVLPALPGVQQVLLALGGSRLVLQSPTGEGALADALRQRLATRGEGPSAVLLAGRADAVLDQQACHGAELRITAPA